MKIFYVYGVEEHQKRCGMKQATKDKLIVSSFIVFSLFVSAAVILALKGII